MHLKEMYNHLCNPAKLYLILSIIAIIIMVMKRIQTMVIVMKIVFAGIFVFLLNFLCKKGYKTLAWIIIFLPYIFLFLSFTNILLR